MFWRLYLLLLAVLCNVTVAAPFFDEDDAFSDDKVALQPYYANKIVTNGYLWNIEKYLRDRPVTNYSLFDYLHAVRNDRQPPISDKYEYIHRILKNTRQTKPIECLTDETYSQVLKVETLSDLMNALKPVGNNTKRNKPGKCVFVMFYAVDCISSLIVSFEFQHALVFYPDIQFVAVDSLRFYSINADYGITGLPTLMLFHQGKPVRKFGSTMPSLMRIIKFLWTNTGIKPKATDVFRELQHIIPSQTPQSDPYLKLAWAFIIISLLYVVGQSQRFKQFLLAMQRRWTTEPRPSTGPKLHQS